jgi:putative endonuclease
MTDTAVAPSIWQVYILECGDGSLYTGIALNLEERLTTHNQGNGAKYTRGRLPVRLVYAEPAPDRTTAARREWAIKKLPRADKLLLIDISDTAVRLSAD